MLLTEPLAASWAARRSVPMRPKPWSGRQSPPAARL